MMRCMRRLQAIGVLDRYTIKKHFKTQSEPEKEQSRESLLVNSHHPPQGEYCKNV